MNRRRFVVLNSASMSKKSSRILAAALTLPSDGRVRVALGLLESVSGPVTLHGELPNDELKVEVTFRAGGQDV